MLWVMTTTLRYGFQDFFIYQSLKNYVSMCKTFHWKLYGQLTVCALIMLCSCMIGYAQEDTRGLLPQKFGANNASVSKYPSGFENNERIFKQRFEDKSGPYAGFSQQQEVLELRDRTTKHFRNLNGEMTAVIGGGPVHFFENGLWNTIITEVVPNPTSTSGDYPFWNQWNEFKTWYGQANIGVKVKLGSGTPMDLWKKSGYAWLDANRQSLQKVNGNPVTPTVQGKTVSYPSWATGVEARYDQLTFGIEQSYILQQQGIVAQRPSNAKYLAFMETLSLPSGWAVKYHKSDGMTTGFTLVNKEGIPEMVYHRPYYEETPNPQRTDNFVTPKSIYGFYEVKQSGQELIVSVLVDADWLSSPERNYPVTIDPVINCTPNNSTWWTSYSVYDGSYNQISGNMRQGFNDITFPSNNEYYQCPIKLNLASIPDGSCINATTFYLYQSSYTDYSGCNENQFRIGRASTDPVVDAFSAVYASIEGLLTEYSRWDVYGTGCGAGCQDYNEGTNGWKTFPCGSTGNSDVASRLTSDWITIAADNLQGYDNHCGGASDDSGWINWEGHASTNMPYLSVNYTTVPINNACANATTAVGGTTYNSYNSCSTTDGPSGSCVFGFGSDIWYAYTAPRTGTASFNTCGSNFDSGLALYTGTCGALVEVACNDDDGASGGNGACGGSSYNAALNYNVTCGATYYIRIGGFNANMGNTVLNITNAPAYTAPSSATSSGNYICPGNTVTLSASGGSNFLPAKWYTSSCGGTLVGTGASIFVSPNVTTTYYVRYEDGCGNNTSCAQVTVYMDNTPPSVTCPSGQTLTLGAGCNASLPDYRGMATKSDNCTPTGSITVNQSPAPGSTVTGTGVTTIVLTASDASGNTASCNFGVTRIDNTPPTISCPATQTLAVLTGCNATLPNYTGLATKSDNCGTPTVTQSPVPGSIVSGVGALTITLTATDGGNNTATCNFVVNKTDFTPPTITCPGVQTLPLGAGCSAALPNYTSLATPSDNCGYPTITQSPAAGSIVNSIGLMTVTLTATDGSGNTATCIFNVNKVDNLAPVPNVPTLPALTGNCSITVTPPSATDNCGGNLTGTTPDPTTYTIPGNYAITWTFNDGNGNSISQIQSVTVTPGSVSAAANTPLCTGADLTLLATGSSVGTYAWSGPNTYNSNTQNPLIQNAQPTNSGTYYVTWTSSVLPSCQATQSINVLVGPFSLVVTPDPIDSTTAHTMISHCAPSYTLYWRKIVANSAWSSLTSAGNTPDITGLQPATAYVAYAIDANGATSDLVYFVTGGTPFCGPAPTPLTAIVNCDKIFVNWGSGYSQYASSIRKVTPTLGPTSGIYTASTTRVFTVTPPNYGATFEVFTTGMCGAQHSITTPPVYVTVNDPRVIAPSGLTFSATCNTITVNWAAVPNATGYYVKIKNTVSGTTFVNFYTSNLTYTRTGMASNFNYEVWVVPVGCSNLQGTPSQHYLVQTCTGTITPLIARPQAPDAEEDNVNTETYEGEVAMSANPTLSVFPNPNNGNFFLSMENLSEENVTVEVVNLLGQVVHKQEVMTKEGGLHCEIILNAQEASGTYFVKIITSGQVQQTKFIKF